MDVRRGGFTFEVEVEGQGPPVLYLHGLGGTGLAARAEVPSGFRVAFYDQRGHGRSTGELDPMLYAVSEFEADTLAVLDALEWDRAFLGGSSMGAAVALRVALEHPSRVEGLLLSAPAFGDTPNPAIPTFVAMADALETSGLDGVIEGLRLVGAPDAAIQRMEERRVHDPRLLTLLFRVVSGWKPFSSLSDVEGMGIPTAIVGWENDSMHPSELARELARLIPAELALLTSPLEPLANRALISDRFARLMARQPAVWGQHTAR